MGDFQVSNRNNNASFGQRSGYDNPYVPPGQSAIFGNKFFEDGTVDPNNWWVSDGTDPTAPLMTMFSEIDYNTFHSNDPAASIFINWDEPTPAEQNARRQYGPPVTVTHPGGGASKPVTTGATGLGAKFEAQHEAFQKSLASTQAILASLKDDVAKIKAASGKEKKDAHGIEEAHGKDEHGKDAHGKDSHGGTPGALSKKEIAYEHKRFLERKNPVFFAIDPKTNDFYKISHGGHKITLMEFILDKMKNNEGTPESWNLVGSSTKKDLAELAHEFYEDYAEQNRLRDKHSNPIGEPLQMFTHEQYAEGAKSLVTQFKRERLTLGDFSTGLAGGAVGGGIIGGLTAATGAVGAWPIVGTGAVAGTATGLIRKLGVWDISLADNNIAESDMEALARYAKGESMRADDPNFIRWLLKDHNFREAADGDRITKSEFQEAVRRWNNDPKHPKIDYSDEAIANVHEELCNKNRWASLYDIGIRRSDLRTALNRETHEEHGGDHGSHQEQPHKAVTEGGGHDTSEADKILAEATGAGHGNTAGHGANGQDMWTGRTPVNSPAPNVNYNTGGNGYAQQQFYNQQQSPVVNSPQQWQQYQQTIQNNPALMEKMNQQRQFANTPSIYDYTNGSYNGSYQGY